MCNSRKAFLALSSAAFSALAMTAVPNASGDTVAQWNYGNTTDYTQGAVSTMNTASTGNGVAYSLGMTNTYAYGGSEGPGATDGSNFTSVTSAADVTFGEDTWKIVGNTNKASKGSGSANGWNNSAPNYTQGAQFDVPTTGYNNVSLSFDWYCTTQGVANLAVQYTDNVNAGTPVWTTVGGNGQGDYIATSNDFYGATSGGVSQPNITISIPADANNDPNFAVRLVSVRPVVGDSDYSLTGPGTDGNYAAASGDTLSTSTVDYNNSSGNWSFDNVTITGTAVPEPASLGLLALSGLALLSRRRKSGDKK